MKINNQAEYSIFKAELNKPTRLLNGVDYKKMEEALLEYRRANKIYEVGDFVVYRTLPHERLFSVRYINDNSIVIYELWDEMGAKTFSEFAPYSDIRHANDAEIEVGRRLDLPESVVKSLGEVS